MMRHQDRAMSNIENLPGGFQGKVFKLNLTKIIFEICAFICNNFGEYTQHSFSHKYLLTTNIYFDKTMAHF